MTKKTLNSIEDLQGADLIAPDAKPDELKTVAARYAVAVTPHLAKYMTGTDGPLARQFLPDRSELMILPEERTDPIGDHAHSPVEGLVHRYPDRVLLKAVHVCPVYCRFCFRREMVGPNGDGTLSPEKLEAAFDYIRADENIWEVILTGGDPLILSPRRLEALLAPLRDISHVKVLRFHTRVPLVDPERINDGLISAMQSSGKTIYVALHANHAGEFTNEGRVSCAKLVDNGISMISQSVLLKGINDDAETLAKLMRTFVENRIKPYYLHHPDLAPGTSHFRLTIEEGQEIVRQLRGKLSGLCQPTYMLDIPGGHGKAVINAAEYENSKGTFEVKDFSGIRHVYPPVAAPIPGADDASDNARVAKK